jgi:hypothetical protein
MDYSLELALNEITVFMAISSIGIIALMGMLLHLSVKSFFDGNN